MVFNDQRRVPVPLSALTAFLDQVARELRFPKNGVSVRMVSDSAMAMMNLKFRRKRGSTDVLSFPASGERAPSRHRRKRQRRCAVLYVGDIAIAPATARRNARLCSRSLAEELRILVLHGMIHLAGYDHESDDGQMDRFERRLRRRFGLSVS
jgi:probable rRNA maturation factor